MAGRCMDCLLRQKRCICREIPRLETRTRFVIIRHARELNKASNTGRLAAAALANSELHDYGVKDRRFDESVLEGGGWLLFPPERDGTGRETGRHAILTGTELDPPERLIVLDGTWGQARRMSHRLAALDAMPRYVLPPREEDPPRLRRAPIPGAMSTLEAIARFLETFEDPDTARVLDELYAEFAWRMRDGHRWDGERPDRSAWPAPAQDPG